MKTFYSILALLLTSNTLIAQGSFFVGAHAGYGKTALLNKEDKDAGKRLDYKTTLKANYGIRLGYKMRNKVGLRSIAVGFDKNDVSQKYTGIPYNSPLKSLTAQTDLKYFKIPIEAIFSFASEKKMIPVAMLGFHINYLRKYHDSASGYSHMNTTSKEDYFYSVNDTYYSERFELQGWQDNALINKGYYQKFNFGATVGAGVEYVISNMFSTSLLFVFDYGLSDAEYKGNIKYTNYPVEYSPWEKRYAKYYPRINTDPQTERSITHLLNMGLRLSLFIHLDGGLLNNKN